MLCILKNDLVRREAGKFIMKLANWWLGNIQGAKMGKMQRILLEEEVNLAR